MERMALERGRVWMVGLPLLVVAALLALPGFAELGLAVAPPALAYAVYGVLAVWLLWHAHERRRTRAFWASVAVLLAALACLHVVPWNSRKVFLREFRQIEPGMSRQDVDVLLRGYEFGERRPAPDALERTYVHSRSGRFDSDWGIVRLQGDRVVSTQFLPD